MVAITTQITTEEKAEGVITTSMEQPTQAPARAVTRAKEKATMHKAISRAAQGGMPLLEKAIIETITGRIATGKAIIMAPTPVSELLLKAN